MQRRHAGSRDVHGERAAHHIEGVELDVDLVRTRNRHFVGHFNVAIVVVHVVNFSSRWTLDFAPYFALLELVHVQVDLVVS